MKKLRKGDRPKWPTEPVKDLTETEKIALIRESDYIVVSVSGGKDSSVLLKWAVDKFGPERLIALHAAIDIDWHETIGVVERQCEMLDVRLEIVKAQFADGREKGIVTKLVAPRIDRKTKKVKQNMWPSSTCRWCTNEMKIVPCDKFIRTLKGKITVLLGERRQEGERGGGSRADLFAWRPKPDLSKNGRKVVKVSPILEMRENEVWDVIEKNNLPKHPCYSWGVSRASCAVCIFSSNREIEIAAEKAPDIVEMLLEAEKKIDHTFHYSNTKKRGEEKETLADILKPYFARKEKEAA